MMKWFYKLPIFGILFCISQVVHSDALDVVNHKNMQLGLYLDAIKYNAHEKIGVLPYIVKELQGKYLEIGTGGDPIAELLSHTPQDADVTIIASDVDKEVLDSLLVRHPELQKYLHEQSKPKLQLQQLNAVDMSIFADNELSGINASSVVHEIVSYAGGLKSCSKFFKEAHRVLRPEGVLAYRDPEAVHNKYEQVVLSLYNKVSKLFAHIFIYKFLDPRGSSLASDGKKVILYDGKNITFHLYKKNEIKPVALSYEEYLQIPSYDIDFSREYKIEMPAGLQRELLRHYLTYLHRCNPLVFVKMIPNLSLGTYFLNYYAHSSSHVVKDFLQKHGFDGIDHEITLAQKDLIDDEIEKNCQVLEFGIPLQFSSKKKEVQLRLLLQQAGFNPGLYIIAVDYKTCLLDYRIFGLLYDQISELFDSENGSINKTDESHASWLKREGEEVYCYYSVDELIANVLLDTYAQSVDSNQLVLCPESPEENMFVERWCYSELLKETCYVTDTLGYKQTIFDGKRIIHFKKKPLKEALEICQSIVDADPSRYTFLQQAIKFIQL